MDYGIIGLFAIELILTFLNFLAWRDVKSQEKALSAQEAARAAQYETFRLEVAASKAQAQEAKESSSLVKGTYYDTLLKRIDTAEATVLGYEKQLLMMQARVASLTGRVTANARYAKQESDDDDSPPSAGDPNQVPAAGLPAANGSRFGFGAGFGSKARKG